MISNHQMSKWGKVMVSTTASGEGQAGKEKGSRNPSPGISSPDKEFQKI